MFAETFHPGKIHMKLRNFTYQILFLLATGLSTGLMAQSTYVPGGQVDQGLAIWLDAADISTLDLSQGGFVNSWTNKGSKNIIASQVVNARRPERISGAFNGNSVLRFRGSHFLRTPAFSSPLTQPNTIIVVWRSSTAHNGNVLDGIDSFDRHSIGIRTGAGSPFVFGWAGQFFSTSSTATQSNLFIQHMRFRSLEGMSNSLLFINGELTSGGNVGTNTLGGLTIGSNQNTSIQRLRGDVAEVLVFDRRITGPERVLIENYLSAKWGIGLDPFTKLVDPDGIHKYQTTGIARATLADEAINSTTFNAGLEIESSQLLPVRSGVAAAHNNAVNDFVSDNVAENVAARWNRTWQIGRSDDPLPNIRLRFDFDASGLPDDDYFQIYDRNYVLLKQNPNSGEFERISVSSQSINRSNRTVTFTLNNDQFPKIGVYTLGYIQELPVGSTNRGWRMFYPPTDRSNLTYEEFLSGIWTQGAVGSNAPSGDVTVFNWNRFAGYTPVTNLNTEFNVAGFGQYNSGAALLVSMFVEGDVPDTYPGYDASFFLPNVLVESHNPEPRGNVNLVVNGGGGPASNQGWYFVGNPYATSLDLEQISRANFDETIYIWNPVTGKWEFRGINYEAEYDFSDPDFIVNPEVSPFQGFFMKANSANANLSVNDGARIFGAEFIGGGGSASRSSVIVKSEKSDEDPFKRLALLVSSEDEQRSQITRVLFSPDGEIGHDPVDAFRLNPLSSNYLDLFTLNESGTQLAINHLPQDSPDGSFEIPLDVDATFNGELTLEWSGLNSFSPDWEFHLLDHATGETIDLSKTSYYTFEFESAEAERSDSVSELSLPDSIVPEPVSMRGSSPVTRFSIQVVTPLITNLDDELGDLPQQLELSQNYPNPFNPTTQIRYALPESDQVRLDVFNVMGQRVATLVNQHQSAGYHTVSFDGRNLSSGVYIYRLQVGGKVLTNKMTLVK